MDSILLTDFYKTVHHLAYKPGLETLVSYWTPRKSRLAPLDKDIYDGEEKIVMFGLQAFLQDYLIKEFNENFFSKPIEEVCNSYKRIICYSMTEQASDTTFIEKLHKVGYLPLEIKALPEGTLVNVKTPMIEIKNTIKGFGYLVNYIETLISCSIWSPSTTATIAYRLRLLVDYYFNKTVSKYAIMKLMPNNGEFIKEPVSLPILNDVKATACGDFSMRGMSSHLSAITADAGHLLSFTGTATIPTIPWFEEHYHADCTKEIIGKGVPSTEHSVMSSYGRDGEFDCYKHLICDVFKTGPISIVSDTYDYWNVLVNYLPKLKNDIMSRDGKVIIRGDSGNPVDIICGTFGKNPNEFIEEIPNLTYEEIESYYRNKAEIEADKCSGFSIYYTKVSNKVYQVLCHFEKIEGMPSIVSYVEIHEKKFTLEEKGTLELLWGTFGGYINSKGYKVLDEHIGAIYGDGITYDIATAIYKRATKKGFAVNNCTLGIGSYTYQYNTRDTFGFALKATNAIIDGNEVQIYKDPITDKDSFKKSQKGMCYVYKDQDNIRYKDELTFADMDKNEYLDNLLIPVFRNSEMIKEYSLQEIRDRLHNNNF